MENPMRPWEYDGWMCPADAPLELRNGDSCPGCDYCLPEEVLLEREIPNPVHVKEVREGEREKDTSMRKKKREAWLKKKRQPIDIERTLNWKDGKTHRPDYMGDNY